MKAICFHLAWMKLLFFLGQRRCSDNGATQGAVLPGFVVLCVRIGNVCTETRCYALHNIFQALVLPCHKGCVGCACCAAYQPTHRFVVAWRQDPNLGKSGLALTPILQWGQIVLFTAFASEGQKSVTSDVIPFPPPQLSPRKEK